ncbi:nitroreductase family protein [Halocatena halophila]|uniref:nitroreductase family protein n=1 Tax=Halocatena halophila TaxID=2814576 RepID=UPI002ECFC51B
MQSNAESDATTDDFSSEAVIEAIHTRRSGHNFDPESNVDDETLEAIIEDATLAPSAYNLQPWEFLCVQDEELLDSVVELAYGQEHIRDAGTAIFVLGHTEALTADTVFEQWVEAGHMDEETAAETKAQSVGMYDDEQMGRDYAIRNASLAAQNLLLSAHARGLSATPMIGFDPEGICELLSVPDSMVPVMLIALGPSGGDEPDRLPRRDVATVLHRDGFEE